MKYAAVLQDPNHSRVAQPRFSFTITDMRGVGISQCYNADFIANPNLGWNISSNNVLWKDWTTVGIDLAPLHGMTINITLTTYDCVQGGHYGYAYFVFQCTNKVLTSDNCTSEENTFHAPAGFSYRWYRQDAPGVTLSTQDTLHVTQAGNYMCDLSFIGAPVAGCSFTMSAIAGIRYPWARFTPVVENWSGCVPTYRFVNNSIITLDSEHDTLTSQTCESYLWTIDDTITSTDINPVVPLEPGYHTVRLEAMIANGSCVDTADTIFFVDSPCLRYDTLDVAICAGGTYRLFDTLLATPGTYQRDSNYQFRVVNLTVDSPLQGLEEDTVCDQYLWLANGHEYLQSGVYIDTLVTPEGCDSIVTLDLMVNSSTSASYYDTCVENQLPRHYLGIEAYGDTSQAFITIANAAGCDSTIHYHLKVHWNTYRTIDSTVCDNQVPLLWRNKVFSEAGIQYDTLPNVAGADSIITLSLHVLPTYHQHAYDTICNNQSTVFENHTYKVPGVYDEPLLTRTNPQCDSIRTLHLFVKDTSVGDTMATACDFFQWYGRSYSASTTDTLNRHHLNEAGCDSTVVLHLSVFPSYNIPFIDTIYYGDTLLFEDSLYTVADTFYTHHYTSIHGCDSLHTLHLLGKTLIEDNRLDSICIGDTYDFYGLSLSEPGIYHDTVITYDISVPDTSVVLILVVLPIPEVSIDSNYTCYLQPHYNLYGHADVPYHLWSASPRDARVEGGEYDSILSVSPQETTTYYYTADYRPKTLCPVTDSIRIKPLDTVEARIYSMPGFYTFENRNVLAIDSSSGHVRQRQWEVWYNDNYAYSATSELLNLEVGQLVDSIMLVLAITSSQCSDTDTVVIPQYVDGIFFPNVFTPSLETNNTFGGVSPSVLQYEIWIYDRRGSLMFHSTDITDRWDGMSNGKPCTMGNYVYHCRYSDKTMPNGLKSITGSVLLLR
ncbi:MAG: gliding motility-associated C-terminal domain-containing protein [Bacteroidales bacterium]|nr:gliding motility-associated C-terminal domain-containing protein [Bacteroidales bacterium]